MTDEKPATLGDELAQDMFGGGVYEAERPPKRDFLPWHRPRKQFVRDRQWREQLTRLLGRVQPSDRKLRYLGLPGSDLLDLRYFHSTICEPQRLYLRFLGFNRGIRASSRAQTELNISLAEVRSLDLVDEYSEVIPDDFGLVADANSLAWRKVKEFGPYDVINLDLCDGFASQEPGMVENSNYNALNCLMGLQAKRKEPWLLFLTTRTGRADIHDDVYEILTTTYKSNLENCAQFRDTSRERIQVSDAATLEAVINTPDGHLTVFLVSLCKWILGLAIGQNPPSKVEVASTIGYRVDGKSEHDDLISLAIKFEPVVGPINDPTGLSKAENKTVDDCPLSEKILRRILGRRRADEILSADEVLYKNMVSATEDLLALARYDVAAYRDWISDDS